MGQFKVNRNLIQEIYYHPCVKCGSENIDFNDCGYSSFNVAWGKCKDCGNEVKISPCGCDISKEDIIKTWNNSNDPKILRSKYQNQIDELQKLIDKLPK